MISPVEADDLNDTDRVIGVVFHGTARAYPLRILNYHEVLRIEQPSEGVEWIYSLWFAWAAFYEGTEIHTFP